MAGTSQGELLNQQRQRQQQIHQEPVLAPLQQQMEEPQQLQQEQLQDQHVHAEPVMEAPNGSKHHPNEAQVQLNQQKAKAKALKLANKKDATRQRNDNYRHMFYNCVKPFVHFGTALKKRFSAREPDAEDGAHMVPLPEALIRLERLEMMRHFHEEQRRPIPPQLEMTPFHQQVLETRTQMEQDLRQELTQGDLTKAEWDRKIKAEMFRRAAGNSVPDHFRDVQRADVEGGTKPVSIRHTESNQRWLVKDAKTCIDTSDPLSPYATKLGSDIQRMVHPNTAIEAHVTHMHGRGTVSYQKMVDNVVKPVDLMKFSRTPESMTDQEMAQIQTLTPQLLREHTTDWLMCNFDTKGENFLTATGTGNDPLVVYGIDKEAGFRRIMDPGAQKMSKDYKGFDQDTVYNRIFQGFAAGTMDLDFQVVEAQIHNVEAMSDGDYLTMCSDYMSVRRATSKDDHVEVTRRIMARKRNLRAEYREFFTKLIEERIANTATNEEEEFALRQKYYGDIHGGTFVFAGDTVETLQQERLAKAQAEANNAELQAQRRKAAAKADAQDESSYKRRHALYDFSKAVVMGLKSLFSSGPDPDAPAPAVEVSYKDLEKHYAKREKVEQRQTTDPITGEELPATYIEHDMRSNAFINQRRELETTTRRQVIADMHKRGILQEDSFTDEFYTDEELEQIAQETKQRLETKTMTLGIANWEEINLGGTKPMSQYYMSDGSKWLAKQAVNCMGYYKEEGVLLTTAGAQLQKKMHEETAVEAFSGTTQAHGFVSFQRRLDNVVSSRKLDLFKFSRHPEIATPETIAQVQELAPQILREHTTDWLLCNFDTKGENFILTQAPDQPMVLHGIDKEAAFHKIRDPKAQSMSMEYKPHANNTLYNVVYSMYAENKMDLNLHEVVAQITKAEEMSPEEYMSMFEPYLATVQRDDPAHQAEIREKILARKTNLRETYETFFTQLVLKRCKHLHPEESAALRAQYFEGNRFKFPPA